MIWEIFIKLSAIYYIWGNFFSSEVEYPQCLLVRRLLIKNFSRLSMIMTEKVKFYSDKSNALQDKIDEQIFELYSSFASIRIKKLSHDSHY